MAMLRSEVKVALTADNEKRLDYTVSYRGVRASSCDELVKRYEIQYAKYSVISMRDKASFFSYLWHLLRDTDTTIDYLICPTYESTVVDGKTFWIPVKDDREDAGLVQALSLVASVRSGVNQTPRKMRFTGVSARRLLLHAAV